MTRNGMTSGWVTVPAILLLGIASGWVAGSGYGNPWFDALAKPGFMPPGWVFPLVWTTLYILMGLALAMLLRARARAAVAMFAAQFLLNLGWSPLFFAVHSIAGALAVIVALDLAVAATILLAWARRPAAAWLLLPYALWLCLATALNLAILRLNP